MVGMKEFLGILLFAGGLGLLVSVASSDVWWSYLLVGILIYSGLDMFVSAKIANTKEKDL